MSLEPSPRLTAKCCVASVCRAPTPSMVLSRKWRPCSTLPDTHDAACVCSHGSQSRPLIASTARPAPSTTPSEPRSVFRAIVASTRPQAPPRAPCVRPAPTARLQDARPRAPSACTSVSLSSDHVAETDVLVVLRAEPAMPRSLARISAKRVRRAPMPPESERPSAFHVRRAPTCTKSPLYEALALND